MTRLLQLTVALATSFAAAAQAQVMDGSLVGDEGFYGAALSTQDTRTQFGDAQTGDPIQGGGGSEINQVFGRIDNGRLYVMITGNLETNFNKMAVFIDSVSGVGQNVLDGDNLPLSVDGFCCGQIDPNTPVNNGALQRMDGFTFDAGFAPDYFITMSNGFEKVNERQENIAFDPDESKIEFWAINAHYAELNNGSNGAVVAAGIQYAPNGRSNVLRNPFDFNSNRQVDAADYGTWLAQLGGTGQADGDGNGVVDLADWENHQNNLNTSAGLDGPPWAPFGGAFEKSTPSAIGPELPGNLPIGTLIDRDYATGAGGCTDDEGNNCVAEELEFVLDVAPDENNNGSNHRNFNNTIDLQMGFDNSNTEGVLGSQGEGPNGDDFSTVDGEDNPEAVTSGWEFSIPLEHLGDPTGDIKITAFINNDGHNFISNQFSGDGIEDENNPVEINGGNLGNVNFFADGDDPALFTLADVVGDQFVTIVAPQAVVAEGQIPEPASVILLGTLLAGLLCIRRR